jgi:hypothetical protein
MFHIDGIGEIISLDGVGRDPQAGKRMDLFPDACVGYCLAFAPQRFHRRGDTRRRVPFLLFPS